MVFLKLWGRNGNNQQSQPDYYEEGVALIRQEFYHKALISLRLALKYNQQDAAALEQMAIAYTRIGLTRDAIRAYRTALDKRPGGPSLHYGLGCLLLEAGAREEAARHFRDFLDYAPRDWGRPGELEHARGALEELRMAVAEASPV